MINNGNPEEGEKDCSDACVKYKIKVFAANIAWKLIRTNHGLKDHKKTNLANDP
mgnify:CR=1 FL=1|jgi:hypothetical protein|tara:strand:- start:364 stop:525 length:162 start_codon:yes stop_codon:yes gene_type:complete